MEEDVRKAATILANDIKGCAPVDTGRLRNEIRRTMQTYEALMEKYGIGPSGRRSEDEKETNPISGAQRQQSSSDEKRG